MAYRIEDLINDPFLETHSLTPGVGESREIIWAHVCELSDPWNWLGDGALVMTTGLAIPSSAVDQVAYVEQCHAVGITAVTIGEGMSAPPIAAETLQRAHELGFPVLSTTHNMPFITLAQAASTANTKQTKQRLETAEHIYDALTRHLTGGNVTPLLTEIGELLDGTLKTVTPTDSSGRNAEDALMHEWRSVIPLANSSQLALEFTSLTGRAPHKLLLQYASAAVTTLMAINSASRRREVAQGSLLFSRLLDDAIDSETAQEMIAPHQIQPAYRIVTWRSDATSEQIESLGDALLANDIPHLSSTRENLLVLLIGKYPQDLSEVKAHIDANKIGASSTFTNIGEAQTAFRQARSALDFPSTTRLNRYENLHGFSPFLSNDTDQLQTTALEILQPLIDYDASRKTSLLFTLQIFLENNKNWSETSKRLHIHRQTLYARIARVHTLTGRDISSVAATSDFWMALQAASSLEMLNLESGHTNI